MRSFKDKTGREWQLDLPFGTVLRLKAAESKFNLLEPLPLAERIAGDETEFWELLWLLIQPQAAAANLGAEQFADSMAADCLHTARLLFFEEWRDFFQSLHRHDKATVVETTAKYLAKAMELAKAKAESPEKAEIDALVGSKMAATLSASFGELRDSLASTPAPSPGAS